MKISLFIFLLLLGKPSDDEVKQHLAFHVNQISFSEFAKSVYDQTGVKIFYSELSVQSIKVSLDTDSISIEAAIEIALKGTSLIVSSWHNNFIVIAGEKLISGLPDFSLKIKIDSAKLKSTTSLGTEKNYLSTRKVSTATTYRIGGKNFTRTNSAATITGKIIDLETRTPILDATLMIEEIRKGTITDKNGTFSININPGKYHSVVECLGYEQKRIFLEILSDGEFVIELNKKDIQIDELMVFGDRSTNMRSKEPGLEMLTIKTIKQIPMMMGELDLLKVSSLLPGIVSVGVEVEVWIIKISSSVEIISRAPRLRNPQPLSLLLYLLLPYR